MNRNKRGISLIVLVITIIVMIILAAAVVIALDNSGIINKANEAVDENNLKQVQHLASLIWAEAYLDEDINNEDITEAYIREQLADQGINTDNYTITVEDNGVAVEKYTPPMLGDLITSANDYGKKIDYTVTVDNNEYKDWVILYEDKVNNYVFITTSDVIVSETATGVNTNDLNANEKALYEIFQLGPNGYKLNTTYISSRKVAWMVTNYANFANKTTYGDNVVGAIGGPTLELLVAADNEKNNNQTGVVTFDERGYNYVNLQTNAGWSYWIASPANLAMDGENYSNLLVCQGTNTQTNSYPYWGIRPVVCLKSSTPATATADGYSIIK